MSAPRDNLPSATTRNDEASPSWLQVVRSQVASVRYGSVILTIHDARVVQVEKQERVRLDSATH